MSHPAPRVSVVMSAYNDAARVDRAVDSILAQTWADLELIAINDGSSDETGSILDAAARRDPRVRVYHQENQGLTRSLIRGCELAQGEYIARQDADDWSHPRRIEEQVALIESSPRIGFVSCATEYVGPREEHLCIMRRPGDVERATTALLHERMGPPAHGSVLIRKAAYRSVGGYRAEFRYSQDSDLWLRLAERWLIAYLPEVRYHHRKEATSISGARRQQQSEFARLAHACRAARQDGHREDDLLGVAERLSAQIESATAAHASTGDGGMAVNYLIGSQLAQNGDLRARDYLYGIILRRPWHWRAWLRLIQTWSPFA